MKASLKMYQEIYRGLGKSMSRQFTSGKPLLLAKMPNHFWLRPDIGKGVTLGVREEWLDAHIGGDIDNVVVTCPSSSSVEIGWSGLICGEGDELYHSVWENVEGTVELRLACMLDAMASMTKHVPAFNNIEVNPEVLNKASLLDDPNIWLFRLS